MKKASVYVVDTENGASRKIEAGLNKRAALVKVKKMALRMELNYGIYCAYEYEVEGSARKLACSYQELADSLPDEFVTK